MTRFHGTIRTRALCAALTPLVALACSACTTTATQTDANDAPRQEVVDPSSAEEDAQRVIRVAELLEMGPEKAYQTLEDAGMVWRDTSGEPLSEEGYPEAMTDSEEAHPIYNALAELGIDQPATGEDYFVGPSYAQLGTGLSPATQDDLSSKTILSPDDSKTEEASADSILLKAAISAPLNRDQLTSIQDAAGLKDDAQTFTFDDRNNTGIISEVAAGTIDIDGETRVWYVMQNGSVSEGGSCSLTMGLAPIDVAENVVRTSVLNDLGQLGSWDEAASVQDRLRLFATAVAQDALVGSGVVWQDVITGERVAWDSNAGTWRVIPES